MNRKTLKKYVVGDFSFRRVLRSLGFIYICLILFAWVWSDKLIFPVPPCSYADLTVIDGIITIPMNNGEQITARYLKHPTARYTVLYHHGNAEDLGLILGTMELYYAKGFSVLSYDYPGYGTSSGRPTTSNIYASADAALKFLVEDQNIALDHIIIHGRSVGGGPALYLAQKHTVAGVIVESTFVSAFRVITKVPVLPFDKFRNIFRINKVDCPLLVIHGRKDQAVPFWHGEKLFQKAKEPKAHCWLDEATHNYFPAEEENLYWQSIISFAERLNQRKN